MNGETRTAGLDLEFGAWVLEFGVGRKFSLWLGTWASGLRLRAGGPPKPTVKGQAPGTRQTGLIPAFTSRVPGFEPGMDST